MKPAKELLKGMSAARRSSFALPLLLLAGSVFAGVPDATLTLSTTTAELGKPIAAVAVAPANLVPDLEGSATDQYLISVGQPKDSAGGKEWPLQVLPLAVGKLQVALRWKGSPALAAAELAVTEPAGLAPNADVSDIKAPARARPLLWPWLLAAALLAAALYAWRRLKRKNGPGIPAAEAADPRSPRQRALDELAALEASPLWAERRYKDFYFQLTEIIRAYLERRYGMPALKLTTHELARQLRQAEVDRQGIALFKELFDRADLVKFAKTTPDAGQGGLDAAAARRLVELTAPADIAAAPPAPAAGGGKA